nr:ankyrin repeat domain-containing protein [Endozoicomonas sp. YOMI1]
MAVVEHRCNSLKALIHAGAQLDIRDNSGCTAMHYAVDRYYIHCSFDASLGLLIKAKAALDVPDHNGDTVLHLAAFNGNLKVVRMLLNAGADYRVTNNLGRTPLALAREFEHKSCAALLQRLPYRV